MTTTTSEQVVPNAAEPAQRSSLLRQIASFALVGGLATLAFILVYNGMRFFAPAFLSNTVAILASSLLNFTLNRRFTFGWFGWRRWFRQLLEFTALLGVTLVASSAGLAALFKVHPNPGIIEENLAVVVASGLLFVVRFWLLRIWVFNHRRR